jgi:hypothetical protein
MAGALVAASCSSDDGPSSLDDQAPAGPPDAVAGALCRGGPETSIGRIEDPALVELSGLATTPVSPGVLWAQQDSGNPAELIAIDATNGGSIGRFAVDAANVDWEDLATDVDGNVLIADTGDNDKERDSVAIISVAVPADPRAAGVLTLPATSTAYRYPGGPEDVEALFVDPETGDRYVVTKPFSLADLRFGAATVVYRLDPPIGDGVGSATEIARLDLGFGVLATGADMAADGRTLVVRTYGSALVWDRPEGMSIAEMFEQEPCDAPAPLLGQSEAVAFTDDGRAFITASEGRHPTLWKVRASD